MSVEDVRLKETTRRIAIDHHHDVASAFETHYQRMAESRFSNAFTYGRAKVDVLLENEMKRLAAGAFVLDAGCGTGSYLRRFHELGFSTVGVEPAHAMLEKARRDNPNVRVEEGVVTALPFEDASFEFVSVIEVFRYLHRDDIRMGLAECFRVLAPGGVLFLTMVNRWALDGFYVLQRARQAFLRRRFTRKHPHCEFFTPAEVQRELGRAGFTNVRTVGRLFAPMRMVYKINHRLGSRVAKTVEPLDDLLHRLPIATSVAGHLVAVAEVPT